MTMEKFIVYMMMEEFLKTILSPDRKVQKLPSGVMATGIRREWFTMRLMTGYGQLSMVRGAAMN
jgi:hypothetical protein